MRPDDLQSLTLPGSLSVRGDLVLVNTATPDVAADAYRGGLHAVSLAGGARRWTWAERDSAPRISPDGRWVAFLRADGPGAAPQLHVMPATGGDARRLTDLRLGAGAPAWSPDSRRLAFTARVPEAGRYGATPPAGGDAPTPEAEAPRHIQRLDYRLDDVGFTADRHPRLFTVDVLAEAPAPVELTDGAFKVGEPAWTADGSALVFVADRDLGAVETLYEDLYTVPADGGEPELLVQSPGQAGCPVALPDGGVLFYSTETDGVHTVARNTSVWRCSVGALTRLTEEESVDCERGSGPPVVVGDGVLVAVRNRGAVELRRVPLDGVELPLAELELLAGAEAEVKSFAADGDVVVAVVSRPDSPGEVVRVGGDVLTSFGAGVPLRPAVELTGSASDGYPVHGWLVLPEGEGPHPVVLAVHGGPFMYHGWGFFDEAQVYAGAGYAVVLPNPRGSAGYGQAHGQALVGAFGTVDVDDVLSLLDVALERPDLDADRVGVMGGSYGGFMTSWLAAHHGERFRAAWSERAVNAWDSFAGSSDIGWFFTDAYCGPGLEAQRAMSPLTYAEKVSMPFMVVHSEHDWRCPLEQAQRMFVALRRNGVEAEMLLFPGEGHELTRSGRPRHRKQRFDAVLEWWGRHLS
ncbi:S9 family peptidase [Saccharothrix algeriensis]|uniref:Dipeptidyl aminopeptidase/acylaminoacyl peptidase n=1 Tax=Saccharothrix algeriensis TaxID=173560 RepID=A0A8T8HUK5_9PSEU|nr:S9 family peptidase [Saccharothrix algeriensis]MBM7813760.1 dipeptidyl aminopeptidase/acylaminoacyl peptidase [Saccharothrix algeriensis]QTR02218.1 S9 family peptidase [Saccharothrix algeriensis]